MKFVHHDLGVRQKGSVIEISFAMDIAKVQLLDDINFANFKKGRNYNYIGGLSEKSPVRLSIPYSGNWHVIVDSPSGGNIQSVVRLLV